jgi:hypothetical protein
MARQEITADDIKATYERIATQAVDHLNSEGTIQPQLTLVWLDQEPGQLQRTEPATGPWLQHLADDKGILRELIRGLLRGPGDRPQLVAQVALVEIAVYRGHSVDDLERVQNPIASEGIMTAVHTLNQTYGAVSQIDAETGHCSLATLDLGVTYADQLSMAEAPTTKH